MKIILLFSILLLAANCSSDKKKQPNLQGADGTGVLPPDGEPIVTEVPGGKDPKGGNGNDTPVMTGDPDETSLNILGPSGSSMRYMDARGLTSFYKHVFTPQAFGYVHCQGGKPREISDCTDSIFTSGERSSMGSFDLYSPRMRRGPTNVNPTENLTLNYTRTLRAALIRECTALVTREAKDLAAKKGDANILVKAEIPTEATINEFMKRLLGVAGSPIVVDVSAAEYVAAFTEVVGDKKDKARSDAVTRSYLSLCMALAMDPQVFLY